MERLPVNSNILSEYVGKEISGKNLLGRGYVYIENGSVVTNCNLKIADICYDVQSEDDEDDAITCNRVKDYLATEIHNYYPTCWIKGIAAEPEDVDNEEVYMIICIETENSDGCIRIKNIHVLARMVEQMYGGWFSIPGTSTMESRFFEMSLLPPEIINEVNHLVNGRYLFEGFSLIGKRMPDNKDSFHQNPPYSMAHNSGWRNVYWHLSVNVNSDDIIEDFEISTYERETSMMKRPHLMDDDEVDSFDCILYFIDQYSDSEWIDLIHS